MRCSGSVMPATKRITVPVARPAGSCWRTGRCRGFCARIGQGRRKRWNRLLGSVAARRSGEVPRNNYERSGGEGDGILLALHGLRHIRPAPAEQVSLMFLGHGAEQDHAHRKEDREEDDGNDENWHTSPLRPFWNGAARHAVTAITARCEGQTRAWQGSAAPSAPAPARIGAGQSGSLVIWASSSASACCNICE